MCVCIYIYQSTNELIVHFSGRFQVSDIYIYIYTYVYMYVYIHICMYIHIYIYTHRLEGRFRFYMRQVSDLGLV